MREFRRPENPALGPSPTQQVDHLERPIECQYPDERGKVVVTSHTRGEPETRGLHGRRQAKYKLRYALTHVGC
jgi:hypothetical protein